MMFETISAKNIDDYVDNDQFHIVDLRAPDEFEKNHIRGAINIPYYELNRFAYYPKEAVYILYCSRGGASMQAARQLSEVGYKVKSVIGGINVYRGPNMV